jgi:protein TonB
MRGTVIAVVLIGLTFAGCVMAEAEAPPRSGRHFSAADMANIANSPTRTLEEVQLAFDRDKQRFYDIVSAYRHRKPGAASGRMIFSITVAPDGTISDCHLVVSTFSDTDFEDQMLSAAKRLHVGARAVPEATFPSYPIDVSN